MGNKEFSLDELEELNEQLHDRERNAHLTRDTVLELSTKKQMLKHEDSNEEQHVLKQRIDDLEQKLQTQLKEI